MADVFNLFNQQRALDYDNFFDLTRGAGQNPELRHPDVGECVRAAVSDATAGAVRRPIRVLEYGGVRSTPSPVQPGLSGPAFFGDDIGRRLYRSVRLIERKSTVK